MKKQDVAFYKKIDGVEYFRLRHNNIWWTGFYGQWVFCNVQDDAEAMEFVATETYRQAKEGGDKFNAIMKDFNQSPYTEIYRASGEVVVHRKESFPHRFGSKLVGDIRFVQNAEHLETLDVFFNDKLITQTPTTTPFLSKVYASDSFKEKVSAAH